MFKAAGDGDLQKVRELLLDGADVRKRDNKDNTPLHEACRKGHIAVADCLVQAGADVNATSTNQMTPLHVAVQGNHTELAKYDMIYMISNDA